MVKISKNLTHIYHLSKCSGIVAIGTAKSNNTVQEELFKKSLALTSDLERLPFLLGGKVYFWLDSAIFGNILTSAISGVGVTVVLMNGSYNNDDFDLWEALYNNPKAKDDILLVCHGIISQVTGTAPEYAINVDARDSHWDFEGQIVLFDTITLLIFVDVDTNVSSADFLGCRIRGEAEIEIDWRPFSKGELQEFIMEHIYAKQGD